MIMVSRLFDLSKAINLNHLLLTKNQNCSKNSDYSLELVRPAHMQWPLVFFTPAGAYGYSQQVLSHTIIYPLVIKHDQTWQWKMPTMWGP